jgi:hypothetical protein
MYPLDGVRSPQIVALSKSVPDPKGGELQTQVAVVTMEMGQRTQEDVVTASEQASLKPALIHDDASHLHVAWLETSGFGKYLVVYASTAPQVVESYDALTLSDVLNRAFDSLFRLSTLAVTLVGSLITWVSVPFIGLLLYHLATSEETLHSARSRVAVIVALGAEIVLTFALPPSIGVNVAQGADVVQSVLRWATPAVSAVVAAVLTRRVVSRQEGANLFGAFFLFTAINSVLQIILFLLF